MQSIDDLHAALDSTAVPAWVASIPNNVLSSKGEPERWFTAQGLPRPHLIHLAALRRQRHVDRANQRGFQVGLTAPLDRPLRPIRGAFRRAA